MAVWTVSQLANGQFYVNARLSTDETVRLSHEQLLESGQVKILEETNTLLESMADQALVEAEKKAREANEKMLQEKQKVAEEKIEKEKLLKVIDMTFTNEQKVNNLTIYPLWNDYEPYSKYQSIPYVVYPDYVTGKLYKIIAETFTSQKDWTPDKAVSLFKEVSLLNEETGLAEIIASSVNIYDVGYIGTFKGRVYKSIYANNGNPPLFEDGKSSGWWEDLGTIEEYLARP